MFVPIGTQAAIVQTEDDRISEILRRAQRGLSYKGLAELDDLVKAGKIMRVKTIEGGTRYLHIPKRILKRSTSS